VRQVPGVVDLSGAILHVTDAFAPETGGVERVVEQIAAEQTARGRRVAVLTKAVPGSPGVERRPDGVTVVRYPHASRVAPWVYLTSFLGGRRRAREILHTDAPALVHYHLTLAAQGPLAALPKRLPSVYSFYGPWHAEFEVEAAELLARANPVYARYLRAQINLQRRLQTRLLRHATRVVVLSEFSRGWVAKLAPHRAVGAVRVPGGINPERFSPGPAAPELRRELNIPDDAFVVFTLRRLAHRMGLDLLLDAIAALPQARPVHLVVGGQGPRRAALEAQAKKLRLTDRVHFLGFVPDELLPAWYRTADLFVVPTRAEENFGLIVLEAAACGAPVAATPAGSLPEVMAAADDRFLATEVSAPALTEVIARAIAAGPEVKDHFAAEVAPRVRREFSWTAIVDRLDALYAELGA
jgi:glycosyltransferase involved in cell wall biosynthesis